jgi:hypothetical protein
MTCRTLFKTENRAYFIKGRREDRIGGMDVVGNVYEWQANFYAKDFEWLAFRGGSWYLNQYVERVTGRQFFHLSQPNKAWNDYGFCVVCLTG